MQLPRTANFRPAHGVIMFCLCILSLASLLNAQGTQKVVLQEEDGSQQMTQAAITPFSPLMQAPETKTTLLPGERNWVRGKAGTTALVNPGDFVFEDGKPVTGAVEFVMTEVTQKSELLIYNLPTTSDGRLLETGGVVKLEAFSEGRPLKLAQGKGIPMEFPDGKRLEMQPFLGTPSPDNGMNWSPIGSPRQQMGLYASYSGGKEGYSLDHRYVMNNHALLKSIQPFLEYGKVNARNLRFLNKAQSVQNYILEQLDTYYPCTGVGTFVVHVSVDESGIPYLVGTETNENRCLTLALQEIVARLRWDFQLGTNQFTIEVERKNRNPIPGIESKFVSIALHPDAQLDAKTVDAFQKMMQEVERREEDQRRSEFTQGALSVTSLGWINCDRFLKQREVVDMFVSIPKTEFPVRSVLVFNELRSVMNGIPHINDRITFNRIPKDMKVKVVTLGYDANGQLYLHVMPLVTRSGNAGTVAVTPVSRETFDKELAQL